MKHGNKLLGIVAALGILVLILDGKTAIPGAQEGIELCLRTVIPSLFPFFVFSIVLTDSLSGMTSALFRPLRKICRIPAGSEAVILTGFLGGYPVGAQAVAGAYKQGRLSKAEANRMLTFCSNAGPSFLFGMIGSQFPNFMYPWLLWAIHLASAIAVSCVYPPADRAPMKAGKPESVSPAGVMRKAITVMATVCGWVILFRVIISFLNRWVLWILPETAQVLLTGLLELANGCCGLQQIENVGLRFLLCSGMVSFGGICVTMQTISVIGELSAMVYLKGKLLQTLFSLILASVCQYLLPLEQRFSVPMGLSALGILSWLLILVVRRKNNSRNPFPLGV